MHFHLPRRHRRKLLFPPGLLALAGLLWLGCRAVLGQTPLAPRYTLNLIMPSVSFGTVSPILAKELLPPPYPQWLPFEDSLHFPNQVYFSGNSTADSLAAIRLEGLVHYMMNDPESEGTKVRFGPTAKYHSFIYVFDLMSREKVKKYFFDNRCDSSNFYIFHHGFGCGTIDNVNLPPCFVK